VVGYIGVGEVPACDPQPYNNPARVAWIPWSKLARGRRKSDNPGPRSVSWCVTGVVAARSAIQAHRSVDRSWRR
jgi:hypothetical protein